MRVQNVMIQLFCCVKRIKDKRMNKMRRKGVHDLLLQLFQLLRVLQSQMVTSYLQEFRDHE